MSLPCQESCQQTTKTCLLSSCINEVIPKLLNYGCTFSIGVQIISFTSNFIEEKVLLLSATITNLQKFWWLLFHDAWSCTSQILPNCCFTVSKECMIQKVIIYCISKVFCSQHTAYKLHIFTWKGPLISCT